VNTDRPPFFKSPLLNRQAAALFLLISAGLSASPSLWATPICHWVDASGRTQYSDQVPEAYQAKAICTDSARDALSPEQQQDALQRQADLRAAQERSSAEADAHLKSESQALLPPAPASAAPGSSPVVKRPTQRITDSTDCTTRWLIYQESIDCFGPFRTTRGATKPEGFEVCNVIESPEVLCGPMRR
jgi:hypothetical protein